MNFPVVSSGVDEVMIRIYTTYVYSIYVFMTPEINPMSVRVQVILDDEEAARIRSQARKESKSLSAWLREAGRERLERSRSKSPLTSPEELNAFFARCDEMNEPGVEPDWEEYKALIEKGYRKGAD